MGGIPGHICLRHLAIVLAIQITGGAASVFSGPGRTTTAGGQNSYRSLKILKSIRKVRNSQNNSAPANQKQFDWHATPVRNRLSSAFDETKRGITKVLTIEPRIIHVADATRLSDEVDEPSAAVHLANARLQKQRKRFDLASRSYSRVLDQEPDHLQALVEFGRMLDQQNRFNEAIVYYRQACKAYPKQASLLNDLALCYARGGSFPASFATFSEAIKLDPGNPLYRNNVAVALVAQNQSGAALDHLVAAHGPAIGHYNLAFLLHQRGNSDLARKHLQTALMHDSQLGPARQMLARLHHQSPIPNQARDAVAPPAPSRAGKEGFSAEPLNRPAQQPAQKTSALSESVTQDQGPGKPMFLLTDWNLTDTAMQSASQHGSSPSLTQPMGWVRRFEPQTAELAPLPRGKKSPESIYSHSLREPSLPVR